jgi:hypothetical protein
MPWTTPKTWVTAEMVTAAMLNLYVRDNLKDVRDQVSARIRRAQASAAQSIPNAVDTRVDMDTIDWDTGGIVDLANDRINIPTSGKYLIGGGARFLIIPVGGHKEVRVMYHDSVANTDVRMDVDGSEVVAGVAPALSTDTIYDCKAGDYVFLNVYQNSGSAQNLGALDSCDPVLYLAREGI